MKLYHILGAMALILVLCVTPVSAADPVVGTWDVTGSMPFLFITIPCAEGTLTMNADGSGVMNGYANLLFFEIFKAENTQFTWENLGGNLYQITLPYAVINVPYDAGADRLSAKVSPAQFGAPIPFDIDGVATRS